MSDETPYKKLKDPQLKNNIFGVPEGYFDSLKEKTHLEVSAEENRFLKKEQLKKGVFNVPDGYFDKLNEKIISATSITKEEGILGNEHLKGNAFTTPENYFEKLNAEILSKVKPEAKIIPLYQTTWFRSVAAAVVLIMVALLSIPKNEVSESELLSEISDEAIINYLEERQAIEYELLSSIEGLDAILDNMILEETSSYSFALNENPELDYDFEYLDY
ncbi:hypothetical protein MB14_04015 [Roseivirga ehrenbergii]|uniref:Uncharacterized protein n=2 Tax=Roseivirga ehrenbergii (strain DSM 102268 / JCM 13514 / KCTC 12282 / NCIMB 14502 / KMM 6017) TaxID=279360 RepID=A0A150X6L9_ROSEK|nr:hypothetical protein MB14_04015 [Roseivirga ehrenbergii]